MWALPFVALVTLIAVAVRRTRHAAVALRVSRWTYGVVMPLSLLYFPYNSGFNVHAVDCEWTFDWRLAIYSLGNFAHMSLCAILFLITYAQFPSAKRAMTWSFAIVCTMGFLVEIAEGATGIHHCRMRDLIPDMAGALIGAALLAVGRYTRRHLHNEVSDE